jgi:hypothetical protein
MTIRLVCWNEALAAERAEILTKAGLDVDASPFNPAGMITRLREDPPRVVLIDLDRLPSHGREVASALRNSKALRGIPIVFAGGAEDKLARIKTDLPDATFTAWPQAAAVVKRTLKKAPPVTVTPVAQMQRYAGSPLARKLDLKKGTKALLIAPEDGFTDLLGQPEDVEFQSKVTAHTTLMLWFVRTSLEMQHAFDIAGTRMLPGCHLWVLYPKKAGNIKTDFNQDDVRNAGLEQGLVDFKICSVDANWSGMKFARRKR